MKKSKGSVLSGLIAAASFAFAFRKSGRNSGAAAFRLGSGKPSSNKNLGSKSSSKTKAPGQNGRSADTPTEIPPRGWFAIAKRVAQKFSENELMSEAASVTFYALLSLFPALTAIVSIYGLFADPTTLQGHLDAASALVPGGGMQIIDDQVKRVAQTPVGSLSAGLLFGILAAVWSANQGSKAMLSALNKVYGERESRGFIKFTATSLAFTVGGILALLVGIGLILVLPLVLRALGLVGLINVVGSIIRWPVVLIGTITGLAILYRFGPDRRLARWRWVTWGGAIGAVGWLALSFGFSWYVEHFGSFNKTYGSLGAVIGFMTWLWLSSTVLLLGAQINAEMESQTSRDTTDGAGRPLGLRGAAAADTVA